MSEGPVLTQADVQLTRYQNTEVEITVKTALPGFIVLNDIWHPWWRAAIDGVETDILKANVLFRAVQVPAGTHKVTFSFRPVEGALAEFRDLVDPPAEEDVVPPTTAPAVPPILARRSSPRWRRHRAKRWTRCGCVGRSRPLPTARRSHRTGF